MIFNLSSVFYCVMMSYSFPCSVFGDECDDHCVQCDVSKIIFNLAYHHEHSNSYYHVKQFTWGTAIT